MSSPLPSGSVVTGNRLAASRRGVVRRMLGAVAVLTGAMIAQATDAPSYAQDRLPNVVVIFMDDMAYADIGPFGAEGYATPHLDRMAAEGMKFTDFVVPAAVCSASRAALLTGCYNVRVGIFGALGPASREGIHEDEWTLAELCRQRGYATAVFGKWHLGHHPKFLPLQHGFDEYFGLPYSNDMWPFHPEFVNLPPDAAGKTRGFPPLPLIEGNDVINGNVLAAEQEQLTTWYTERSVDFIERHADRPFFLYVPHSMVHVPLYVSDKFRGKSQRGLFGDVVMEVDWSVGQILDTLRRLELEKHTLVVFTSDNGPWLSYGDHAGSAGPLREGKGTEFEGGIREPTLMWWPGRIPAGTVCDELASTIDLLPTVAALVGGQLPDHPVDGHDIRPLMFGEPNAQSPHEAFYCYYGNLELHAVRDRRWKLHFPHSYRTLAGRPGGTGGIPVAYENAQIGRELYDLKNDIGETTDVSAQYPEQVERLERLAERARQQLGDRLTNRQGASLRPVGQLLPGEPELVW